MGLFFMYELEMEMSMGKKEIKTNAMRILDKHKMAYQVNTYECEEFIDGIHIANQLGQPLEQSFKTLVTVGKSGGYYVYVIPVDRELDLKKAAKAVGEKSVEMLPVKEINHVTGYIRGGCTPIGMKKLYPTVLHSSAVDYPYIIISGGKLGLQIQLAPMDLVRAVKAKVEDIVLR